MEPSGAISGQCGGEGDGRTGQYDLNITGVTDYGVAMDAILGGQEKVPPQGARFDVAFIGPLKGRVCGSLRGVDYLRVQGVGAAQFVR